MDLFIFLLVWCAVLCGVRCGLFESVKRGHMLRKAIVFLVYFRMLRVLFSNLLLRRPGFEPNEDTTATIMSTTEERRITTSAHESDLRSPDQIPRSPQAQGFNINNHTTPRATHGRPFQESPLSPSPRVYPSSSYLTPQGNSISANLNSSVSAASSRSFAASPGLVSQQASLSASLASASPAAHSLRPDDISSSVSSSPQVIIALA
jgi:hypothetical protein